MSFSAEVKEELGKHISSSRHCQLAEMAAFLHFCGQIQKDAEGEITLQLVTENIAVVRKCFTILNKTFNIDTASLEKECYDNHRNAVYSIVFREEKQIMTLLQAVKLIDSNGVLHAMRDAVNPLIVKSPCCQRSFIRGAYLCCGSMSDPGKSYHLELVCSNRIQAEQLRELLVGFDLNAKIVSRKKYQVVYIKEGANISDFLNVCEAHISLMNFENLRILKEVGNSINRRVNCETANSQKTVSASVKQVQDIHKIQKYYGFSNLSKALREMAEVRLEYPDANLKELGQYLDPPVGKSGVNHRLRKLSEIAESIKP